MRKILGLDLGVASIGWALIEEKGEKPEILGMGSRIVPLDKDDKTEFSTGNAISKNQNRTRKRTARKGYDRFQLRRKFLIEVLKTNAMLPDTSLYNLAKLELWSLRDKAAKERISLQELGRVLLHLNQKRGYKSSRAEANMDKKDTEYVAAVKTRYEKLKETGLTIGQYFYKELKEKQEMNEYFRIKGEVYPREAYIEEFDKIIKTQQVFHKQITKEIVDKIRNEIIYYQRKLKSQKGLVSVCEFEGFWVKTKEEKELFVGPKVAPKSSPLFQVCKIWETINNIRINGKRGQEIVLTIEQKREIFEYLDNNEQMKLNEILKILNLKKDEVYGNKLLEKGLQGNLTKVQIAKCFDDIKEYQHLFQFNLKINEEDTEVFLPDRVTGEIISTKKKKIIDAEIEKQPFYQLWHTIYSIADKDELLKTLTNKFNIPVSTANNLAKIDFTKQAFGNKSHKAIRKLLPYLMEGDDHYTANSYAGYNHMVSLTKNENIRRQLENKIKLLEKNSLRQPIVEKILNQLINLVNAIIDKYGKPDEIRIELARELKQSKEERNDAFKFQTKREKENEEIKKRLSEYGLRATRNNTIKWRLYQEIDNELKKQNAICMYCGHPISLSAAITGEEVDVDHIIPQSRLFDDSQSNKTLVHRKCNATKSNLTAYDFMKAKGTEEFDNYIERINTLYKNQIIGKKKRDYLLMPGNKIPDDFINRQLGETRFISKKAREILQTICHNVWVTSGMVTAELRHIWGWDKVLENLQMPKYREAGLTEIIEEKTDNGTIKREVIKNWSKREDHRHHAIDALTIACTQQSFIQRINHLNSDSIRTEMKREIEARQEYDRRKDLLENYIFSKKPFETSEVERIADNILISYKAGKKVATFGKRKIKKGNKKVVVQENIIVPRGALSEESVYGKILVLDKNKPIKYLFEKPHLIFKPHIKSLVETRIAKYNGDVKAALASLKKEPILLQNDTPLEYGTCYKEEYVLKYPIESLKEKDIESIIDNKVKEILETRIAEYGGNVKEAFKDIEKNPIWFNKEKGIPIKRVRLLTGLSAVEPVKKDENNKEIGFVKPGNNHHLAIYKDEDGNRQIHICSFWHAVERKKYGLPVIIKNPAEVLDKILDESEEKYPESFLEKLPDIRWQFETSMMQNEMFLLGLNSEAANEAIRKNDYALLSKYLYRVQKLAVIGKQPNIYFRYHLETQINDTAEAKQSKRFYIVQSISAFLMLNPLKVRVNNLGELKLND